MQESTKQSIRMSLHGLDFARKSISEALIGKPEPPIWKEVEEGPFALALQRLGETRDDAAILPAHTEQVKTDLIFAWKQIRHLGGFFYSTLWEFLAPIHELTAIYEKELNEKEARAFLGKEEGWLNLDASLGHIHPFERSEKGLITLDMTFLHAHSPLFYARYELEDLLARKKNSREAFKEPEPTKIKNEPLP